MIKEGKALQEMERQSELEETPLKNEEGSEEKMKRKEDVLIIKVLV